MKVPKNKVPDDLTIVEKLCNELVNLGCPERSTSIYCSVKGLQGEAPKSLRRAWPGISGERVRQVVLIVESRFLPQLIESPNGKALGEEISILLSEISKEAPNSNDEIKDALAKRSIIVSSPAGVLRLAELFRVHSDLASASWVGLSKYHNENRPGSGLITGEGKTTRVEAIVPSDMPDVFTNFLSLARRVSRGMGAMSARSVADLYTQNRGLPLGESEAKAMLAPFAIYLGRIDGDDWFTFYSSTNEFISKAAGRVTSLGEASFSLLCDYHERFNRSEYINVDPVSREALRLVLEVSGFEITGDVVTIRGKVNVKTVRSLTPIQERMISVFRQLVQDQLIKDGSSAKGEVPRHLFSRALVAAGINETTAHIYLSNRGIFTCHGGLCRLNDKLAAAAPAAVKQEEVLEPVLHA